MNPKKALLYVSLTSIVMMFGGLTSAIIVAIDSSWFAFELPVLMWVSTSVIILSSVTMNWAVMAARKGNTRSVIQAVGLTLLLGIGFTGSQFMTWTNLVDAGVFFVGTHMSASFVYVLTGLHLTHLAAGLITLLVVLSKSINIIESYNKERSLNKRQHR